MPYINEIVDIVNTKLANGVLSDGGRFIKKLHGVSELIQRNLVDKQDTIPILIDTNGGTVFSGFNDVYSIVIYHRCVSTNILSSPIVFGDGGNTFREEANMKCVIWAKRNIVQMPPPQLAFFISSSLNTQLNQSEFNTLQGLYGVNIESSFSNFDSVSLFVQEYKLDQSNYKLSTNDIYFSIDYKIITDYDITCISNCPNC